MISPFSEKYVWVKNETRSVSVNKWTSTKTPMMLIIPKNIGKIPTSSDLCTATSCDMRHVYKLFLLGCFLSQACPSWPHFDQSPELRCKKKTAHSSSVSSSHSCGVEGIVTDFVGGFWRPKTSCVFWRKGYIYIRIYVTCLCDLSILFNHIHSMSITISLHFCLGGLENELSHVGEGSYSLYHLADLASRSSTWNRANFGGKFLIHLGVWCVFVFDAHIQVILTHNKIPPKKQTWQLQTLCY